MVSPQARGHLHEKSVCIPRSQRQFCDAESVSTLIRRETVAACRSAFSETAYKEILAHRGTPRSVATGHRHQEGKANPRDRECQVPAQKLPTHLLNFAPVVVKCRRLKNVRATQAPAILRVCDLWVWSPPVPARNDACCKAGKSPESRNTRHKR